ncbi:MAG TPA: hypothetical protein ENG12_00325 [Candidatus Altiarchaeales archaeon]|nr:hypothetical protein [Candidatus Altiarchaeales archaeon]
MVIIITTTTTTTTTTIFIPPTTIVNARCYMNSDCGSSSVSYYCKIELVGDEQQPTARGEAVYRVTRVPICRYPGTPWARCETIRWERLWYRCKEGEHCIDGCYTCVPEGCDCPS